MDRARRSPLFIPVLFVAALAATMVVGGILILVPAAFKASAILLSLVPIAITICGIVSLLTAGKPANTTLLWVIIMILAPLLGPLLWFAWGRRNT